MKERDGTTIQFQTGSRSISPLDNPIRGTVAPDLLYPRAWDRAPIVGAIAQAWRPPAERIARGELRSSRWLVSVPHRRAARPRSRMGAGRGDRMARVFCPRRRPAAGAATTPDPAAALIATPGGFCGANMSIPFSTPRSDDRHAGDDRFVRRESSTVTADPARSPSRIAIASPALASSFSGAACAFLCPPATDRVDPSHSALARSAQSRDQAI